jgi:membrane-associated protease RseP (regulator of RpoE activity)
VVFGVDAIVAIVLALAIVILFHELAHAAFALALNHGEVRMDIGFGPGVELRAGRVTLFVGILPLGGMCTHEDSGRRGDRALIAAAGPVASAFLAALAWSLGGGTAGPDGFVQEVVASVVVPSAIAAVLTALPIRYPDSLVPGGGESDGLVILRAAFPASRLAIAASAPVARPERTIRPLFAIPLLLIIAAALALEPLLGALTLALFALVYWLERRSRA